MLQNGWTLGSPQLMRVLQGVIWTITGKQCGYWKTTGGKRARYGRFSRSAFQSRALREPAQSSPGKPFVTILTDIADYPPHFWIERQEQFLICGSERAVQQARELGHRSRAHLSNFRNDSQSALLQLRPIDRDAERLKLGLEAARITVLVLFGGQGARKKMLDIDRRLSESGLPIQLILICGKNERLASRTARSGSPMPRLIEGFTTNIPYYMQLADFFVGKPGPGSIAEALDMGLPVIVERNAWTLPQERYNAIWVREKQVGLVCQEFRSYRGCRPEMLERGDFHKFRCNAKKMRNRALFEIPEILGSNTQGI